MNATWTSYSEQLLIALVNQVRILAWQNTKDGHKGTNPPTPIPLPEQLLEEAEKKAANTAKAKALAERLRQRRAKVG